MKNAQKLIKDIEEKIRKWDEYHQFKLKGIGNLSRSDMDTLQLYAEQYVKNDCRGFSGFMKPLGNIKAVLDAYDLTESERGLFD